MSGRVSLEVPEDKLQAFLELLDVAAKLKETGMLGWLKTIAESGEKLVELAASDDQFMRLLGLLQALAAGAASLEPGDYAQARGNAEQAAKCLFQGLRQADPVSAPRVGGLFGLMGALRDPHVQKGLGFLIQLARGVGGCLEQASRAGQGGKRGG